VDLLLEAAAHLDRRDPLDRLELALDLPFGEPAQAAQPLLAGVALLPVRASSITGSSDGSKRSTSGRSAVSGSSTWSSRSSVSWTASATVMSHWNSSTTSETPAREIEEIRSRPPMTPSASSSGRLISFSTSSGAAPGYSVRTVIVG